MIDDLSPEDANFSAKNVRKHYTPTLDALAAKSVVLDNNFAVSPMCMPSRYAMLTGNYPSRATSTAFQNRLTSEGSAVPEFNTLITPADQTLPKRLKTLGFRTGIVGKDHVMQTQGYSIVPPNLQSLTPTYQLGSPGVAARLAQDQQVQIAGMQAIGFDEAHSLFPMNPGEYVVPELRAHNLDWIAEGAIRFIDNNADNKFFLVVSLTIPHAPLDPAKAWNADPRITPFGLLDSPPTVLPARSTLTQRVASAGFSGDENYLWMDDSVAAVMNRLDKHGLKNSTAVIVTGDHGSLAKGSIYLDGLRTPGFFNYRNFTGRTSQLTSLIDVQNTILDSLGAPPAGDGVSLLPLLSGGNAPVRDSLVFEVGYARAILEGNLQYIALRHSNFIRERSQLLGFPLTQWPRSNGLHSLEKKTMNLFPWFFDADQLYDVQSDPKQQVNLFGRPEHAAASARLQEKLQAHADKTPGSFKVK